MSGAHAVTPSACACPAAPAPNSEIGPYQARCGVHLPECAIGLHRHAEARIVLSLDHAFATRHGSDPIEVVKGAALYRPPESAHVDRYAAPTLSISILLPPALAERAGERAFALRHVVLGEIVPSLRREIGTADTAGALVLEGLARMLVALVLARGLDAERGAARWIARVRERLEDDPAATPSLRDLAQEVQREPTHVAATFKRLHGISIGAYLRRVRLARACGFIASHPECRLADVGAAFGFSDQSHFARHFRRQFGVTPGEYRRRQCGAPAAS